MSPEKISEYLSTLIPEGYSGLTDSMRYSLLAGGKRIRPVLVLEFARMCGADENAVLPIAAAIEMIHTYSLIHDDLPCMDNDDLRRGKPTNHKVYGECTATLAGDALQPLAFETILESDLPAERKVQCADILAEAAGYKAMCGGQYLDMLGEGKELTADELDIINNLKTGALLSAACMLGVAAAGGTMEQMNAAKEYGVKLGLAFQIRDDMLDVLSSNEELGKPVGSDAQENKNTYMALLGGDECAKLVHALTEEAVTALSCFEDSKYLADFARKLENRTH